MVDFCSAHSVPVFPANLFISSCSYIFLYFFISSIFLSIGENIAFTHVLLYIVKTSNAKGCATKSDTKYSLFMSVSHAVERNFYELVTI